MRVLVIKPHKRPEIQELADLKAMQKCVGGYIQAIYPWDDTPAALVCDEDGLQHGEDWNRYICKGVAIKGTFFICGLAEDDFTDLPDELMCRFEKEFQEPEEFLRTPKGVLVLTHEGLKAII